MKLFIRRSQSQKSKFLGGSETIYSLNMKAEVPEEELKLLTKYDQQRYSFDLPDNFPQMFDDKLLVGPPYIGLQELLNGVEIGCKFLAESFCALPEYLCEQHRDLLARLQAREEWGGEYTIES